MAPGSIGVSQTAIQLPSFLLLLVGGVLADNSELKSYLKIIQIACLCAILAFASIVQIYGPTIWAVIAFGCFLSAVSGLSLPGRGAYVHHLVRLRLIRTMTSGVGFALLAQSLGYLCGIVVGGLGVQWGSLWLICMMFVCWSVGLIGIQQLPPRRPPEPDMSRHSQLKGDLRRRLTNIFSGLGAVLNHSILSPVVSFVFFGGVIFNGVVLVYWPVYIREMGVDNALSLSGLYGVFFAAMGAGAVVAKKIQGRFQGRAIILSTLPAGFSALTFFVNAPIWLLCIGVIVWGLANGIAANFSRTIVQTHAAAGGQAQALSTLQLASLAGSPLGAPLIGLSITVFGLENASLVPVVLTLFVAVVYALRTNLWKFRPKDQVQ